MNSLQVVSTTLKGDEETEGANKNDEPNTLLLELSFLRRGTLVLVPNFQTGDILNSN